MSSYTPHPLALPQSFTPDLLDTLTDLSSILQKIHATAQESLSSSEPTSTKSQSQQQTTNKQTSSSSPKKLSFKDAPNATDPIKHKLQRAREQVCRLPDMDRSISEQEAEIAELEARIGRQRDLLEGLRDGGLAFGKREGDRMEE